MTAAWQAAAAAGVNVCGHPSHGPQPDGRSADRYLTWLTAVLACSGPAEHP